MFGSPALAVGAVTLVTVAVTMYSSVHVVEEGDQEALLVFGEMRAVLDPGLAFVPPFVSSTYPIDPETLTFDTGDERVDIPEEFRYEVDAAATA